MNRSPMLWPVNDQLGRVRTRRHFQLVGQRWSLTPGRPWGQDQPANHLVVIGLQDLPGPAELAVQLEEGAQKTTI
jgi:hypothetical protein